MAIAPKPTVTTEQLNVRMPQDVLELLDDYCRFLGGASDRTYVIVEALRQTISRDRRYREARETRRSTPPAAGVPSTRSSS